MDFQEKLNAVKLDGIGDLHYIKLLHMDLVKLSSEKKLKYRTELSAMLYRYIHPQVKPAEAKELPVEKKKGETLRKDDKLSTINNQHSAFDDTEDIVILDD